jgi:hypothetical protein
LKYLQYTRSTYALEFIQPPTEISETDKKGFVGSKAQQARKDDNLTAICEPIV